MGWNLEQAKEYLGIPAMDPSQDEQIQAVLDQVYAEICNVLGRQLGFARETIKVFDVCHGSVLLPRFPVARIHSMDPEPLEYRLHGDSGRVDAAEFWQVDELTVDYEGGYITLPMDLERAMWEAFMSRWDVTDKTTGGPPVDPEAALAATGDVKALTIFDSFKVDYDVNPLSTTSVSQEVFDEWGWLAPWASRLAPYRAGNAGVGLGIA